MKRIILLLLLLMPLVSAQPSPINILNLEYDNGDITLQEKFSSIGYSPDRRIQRGNYVFRVLSKDNRVLHSFRFQPETLERLDGHDDETNLGGVIIRNRFNFVLITPSFAEEQSIQFFDETGKDRGTIELEKKGISLGWILLPLLLFFLLLILYLRRKQKTTPSTT